MKVLRSVPVPRWRLKYGILEVNQIVEYNSRYTCNILYTIWSCRPYSNLGLKWSAPDLKSQNKVNVKMFNPGFWPTSWIYIYLLTLYKIAKYVSCQVISLYYKPVIIDFKFMFLENSRSIEWLTHCRLGLRIAYTIVLIRKQSTVTFSRCYPDKLKMRCCKILDDPIIIKFVSALNTLVNNDPSEILHITYLLFYTWKHIRTVYNKYKKCTF